MSVPTASQTPRRPFSTPQLPSCLGHRQLTWRQAQVHCRRLAAGPAHRMILPCATNSGQLATQNDAPSSLSASADAGAPLQALPGSPQPLGASPAAPTGATGVNFALAAPHATGVALCLHTAAGEPLLEAPMHRDGSGVWHTFVSGLAHSGVLYAFKVAGEGGGTGGNSPFRWDSSRPLLDPYAKYVVGRAKFGQRDDFEQFQTKAGSVFRGTYDFTQPAFNWGESYRRPAIPPQDLVVMELPVRTFTADPSSGVPAARRGTFLGLADKAAHLLELGVNAVELLPVFEYDELEFQRDGNPRDHMTNIWGYSHLNFFAPMSRFGATQGPGGGSHPVATANEFKEMVRRLHAAGIEVILDVVYNHTAEADDADPYMLSWRGIDCKEYYQQDKAGLVNLSGCGNTVASNAPLGMTLILDSLKWWVREFHVDGFRFDLASCLCRDSKGQALEDPPLIRAIAKDPELAGVKMIAEPWDIGMYQVGTFPAYGVWAEWNGKFRDDVRKFIRGDPGMKAAFATRLSGSEDLYATSGRRPYHSINFIVAHDGFTLYDMVSYNEKHNDANGEGNRDGTNDNFSWNCGAEGGRGGDVPHGVAALRERQMRNMHLALMLSQGVPMLVAGDEYAQSRDGNNNWYGHDSRLTHFRWDELQAAKDAPGGGWFRFYTSLIKFRRSCPLLGRPDFLTPAEVTWHEDRWDEPDSRFLAFTLHDDSGTGCGDLYAAFNAHSFEVSVHLPQPPHGKKWCRIVDTNLPSPKDFTPGGNAGVESVYGIQAYASILLVAKDA